MYFHAPRETPERPEDPAKRRANLRRIGPLFRPYKLRLSGLLLLIVGSSALGVLPAFLLKRVLEAIDVAVFVTTLRTPPMSFEIRDCTSPVRVRVKKASERRWRCRKTAARRSCITR